MRVGISLTAPIEMKNLDLRRGDMVLCLEAIRITSNYYVVPGAIGVVFEETNAYGDNAGPMVRWMNGFACNIYKGQAKKINLSSWMSQTER